MSHQQTKHLFDQINSTDKARVALLITITSNRQLAVSFNANL